MPWRSALAGLIGFAAAICLRAASPQGEFEAAAAPRARPEAPSILDVRPERTFPGGQALLTVASLGRTRYAVWAGSHRIPRRFVREEAAPPDAPAQAEPDAPRTALRVFLSRSLRSGTYAFRVKSRAGVAVSPKSVEVVKCTILPAPFDIQPLGDKVFIRATLRGPGGTHREFSTPNALPLQNGIPNRLEIQGCGEPDRNDSCRRILQIAVAYDVASTESRKATIVDAFYVESSDFEGGTGIQDVRWSASIGTCQITKSTNGRIGGYFTATLEGEGESDLVSPRFTVEGSFVIERP